MVSKIALIIIIIISTSCSKRTAVITEWDGDREIRWYSKTKKNDK